MIAVTKNTENPYYINITSHEIIIKASEEEKETGAMYLYTLGGTPIHSEVITEGVTKISRNLSNGQYVLHVSKQEVTHVEIISI